MILAMSEDQAVKTLLESINILIHLGYTLAGLCVFMLAGILAFIIGWQLRQDKKQADHDVAITENRKTGAENTRMIEKNIPELYEKWDAIITGCVQPVVQREIKKVVEETQKNGKV